MTVGGGAARLLTVAVVVVVAVCRSLASAEAQAAAVLLVVPKSEVRGDVRPDAPEHPLVVPVCPPVTATVVQKAATAVAQALAIVEAEPGRAMPAASVEAMADCWPATLGLPSPKVAAAAYDVYAEASPLAAAETLAGYDSKTACRAVASPLWFSATYSALVFAAATLSKVGGVASVVPVGPTPVG